MLPDLLTRVENGLEMPFLVWRFATPLLAIASGPLGGGIGARSWVINATVPMSYNRDDPDIQLASLAASVGLSGPGLGFMTGVDVGRRVVRDDGGALVVATVGIGEASWAAAVDAPAPGVGTVNVFAFLPVRLSDAALVNAVATVAEAKAQAFIELGYAGTGTATDATCVLCPLEGVSEPYGGPRSTWGARLARAVHQAVLVGDRTHPC